MKKLILLLTLTLTFLLSGCSIGKDKKEFTCDKWEVSSKNSQVADRLNAIASSALGSKATFEFYDTQIKMNFQGDHIVFTKNENGSFIYEQPYYYQGKSGKVRYHLCPKKGMGYNFVTSCDLYFSVEYNDIGQASFSRDL